MKAVVGENTESVDSYHIVDAPTPMPGPGQVLVRVMAAGVGYVDTLVSLGGYQVKPKLPHTPGGEVAGIVEAVGEGVRHLAPGDRVMALGGRGFAEFTLTPAPLTVKIPDTLDFPQAASLPLNYLTAIHGLKDRGAMAAGETVLIFGAAGGVGSAAVQVSKALGATVIAAASTEEKRAFCLSIGADFTIDTEVDGWRDRLKQTLDGKKPDVVFDPVCGPLFEAAFRSLNWRGRHLVVGFVGGPIPALPANLTLMKGADLMGVDVRQYMEFEFAKAVADLRLLAEWAGEGRIKPPIDSLLPFTDFRIAMTSALKGQAKGKIVLQVG